MNKIVFTNGVFDNGLHAGHINLLMKCRSLVGRHGRVIVGIDSDKKARADKGQNRPIYNEFERQYHLKSLVYPVDSLLISLVDEVSFFDTNEHLYELIKRYSPDFIVKGSDWTGNVVGSDLAEVIYVDLNPSISVTKTENRIKNGFKIFDPEVAAY